MFIACRLTFARCRLNSANGLQLKYSIGVMPERRKSTGMKSDAPKGAIDFQWRKTYTQSDKNMRPNLERTASKKPKRWVNDVHSGYAEKNLPEMEMGTLRRYNCKSEKRLDRKYICDDRSDNGNAMNYGLTSHHLFI